MTLLEKLIQQVRKPEKVRASIIRDLCNFEGRFCVVRKGKCNVQKRLEW
jgi:hypothetical protein